jgi:transcription elongation GreA/GreB family factor
MNKESAFKQISAHLRDAQEKAEQARDDAQQEANQHVGRMESRYDTFKQEAQYEVEAQESRISEYQKGIGQINALLAETSLANIALAVQVGSGINLQLETGEEKFYLLSPAGAGIVVADENASIFTLTPDSPLGKQLLGLRVGDSCGQCVIKEIF